MIDILSAAPGCAQLSSSADISTLALVEPGSRGVPVGTGLGFGLDWIFGQGLLVRNRQLALGIISTS